MKKFISMLVASLMLLSLASCSNGTNSSSIDNANQKKTLKIVAAIGNKEDIFKQFQNDTGIKVEFLDISSGEVLSRALAQKGTPVADVWFGGGADGFMAAAKEDLLESYVSEEAKNISDKYKDKDGYWTGMSIVTTGFVVNNDVIEEKNLPMPTKWTDLTNPIYKDEILMPNPNISGTSYCIISSLIQEWGEEKAWEYLEELDKNIPYYPQRGGEPPQKALAGEVAIAISPLDGEQIAQGEGLNVTNVFPEDGIPWTVAPVAIFKGAENMDAAKQFVDWVLSKSGQETIAKFCPRIPVREDIEIPEVLKDVDLNKLLDVDMFKAGEDRDNILGIWNEKIAK